MNGSEEKQELGALCICMFLKDQTNLTISF